MSFKTDAATVRAGLKAGKYKKADPDPYGLMGFAEQVTFGVRAEAEQRRKEDLLAKKEEAAATKLRNEKIAAKEAADKKIRTYINRAMANKTGGYTTPLVDTKGMAGMNERIFIEAQDRGLTTYAQIESLLEADNFQIALDQFYTRDSDDIDTNTNPVVETPEVSSNTNVSTKIDTSTNTENLSTSDKLETAAKGVNAQMDAALRTDLFNSSKKFDVNTLKIDNWEEELDKLKSAYELTPNKFPNYAEDVARIQEYANNKGWVRFGTMTLKEIREMPASELKSTLRQIDEGIGAQLSEEKRKTLGEYLVAKEEIEKDELYWNKPKELFEMLADPKKKLTLLSMLKMEAALDDKSQKVKNIQNAITLFDAVQNDQPLSDEILQKMVGASANTIEGLKTIYYKDASAEEKVIITKLESLAKENDASNMKPKDRAYTSWANRIGLKELLNSDDNDERIEAERLIAEWENRWSEAVTLHKKPKEFWQKPDSVSKMSLEEVNILLDTGLISQSEDPDAFLVLSALQKKLMANQSIEDSSELADIKTTGELMTYLIGNRKQVEADPALEQTWIDLYQELTKQEASKADNATLNANEMARRKWMEDNNITDRRTMTLEQIGNMEAAVKAAVDPVDNSDPIIEGSDTFFIRGMYLRPTENGNHRSIFDNSLVKLTDEEKKSPPLSEEKRVEINKEVTRIRDDVLTPMINLQSKSLATLKSGRRLSEIASANPEVLGVVGDVTAFLGTFKIQLDVLKDYANRQVSPEEMARDVLNKQGINADKLVGTAKAKALFRAEVLKYAYLYASVNLEQSGRGLSDNDFNQALKQVNAGMGGIEAFEENLRYLSKESFNRVRTSIEYNFGSPKTDENGLEIVSKYFPKIKPTGFEGNFEILDLESRRGKLQGFVRNMDQFVDKNRLQDEITWLQGGPSTSSNETGGGTGGGNGGGEIELYGDGVSLDEVPQDIITGVNSVLSFARGRQKSDEEIARQLKKRYPKLGDAQIQTLIGGN